MVRLRHCLTVLFLVMALLLLSCDSENGDNSDTQEQTYGSIEGTWSFTLSPQEDSEGEADECEEIVIYENDGVITGYVEFFTFHGTRSENELVIDVVRSAGSTNSHESTMRMTITSEGHMVGTGTLTYPAIEPFLEQDGTVHPKFTDANDEWDGGEGSVHFYNITAVKTGAAASPPMGVSSELPDRRTAINWCNLLIDLERVPLFFISPGGGSRPFGNCGITHDGGGSYLSGRDGPGTKYSFCTTTEYYAFEYSWCHVRSYSFHIKIEGEIDRWDVVQELRDNPDDYLRPDGMSLDDYIDGFENFRDTYGGFAICTGYSSRSDNFSIYLLTTRDHSRHTVLEDPWMRAVYDQLTEYMDSDDIWVFGGKHIHDTWNLRRSLSTLCNSYVDFTYVVGTHEVNFD